jgi:DNA-binding CsgD family transcriptional regulator
LSLIYPWRESRTVRLVAPALAFGALLATRHDELAHRRREFDRLQAKLRFLLGEYESVHGRLETPRVPHVGPEAHWRRLRELASGTEREWLWLVDSATTLPDPEVARRIDQRLLSRGISLRALYPDGLRRNHPVIRDHAQWQTSSGGEVRTVVAAPPALTLIDRCVAVVPLDPAEGGRGGVEIRGGELVAVLSVLADLVWDRARPAAAVPIRAPGELSELEAEVLRLLGQGLTDASIAAKLSVSARTVSRSVASLMERLGARSRFQAGLRAHQLGWVE